MAFKTLENVSCNAQIRTEAVESASYLTDGAGSTSSATDQSSAATPSRRRSGSVDHRTNGSPRAISSGSFRSRPGGPSRGWVRPVSVSDKNTRRSGSTWLERHPLWRDLMLRVALVLMLGLLAAAALLVGAAFNNGVAWLLMLSLVSGLILGFSPAAGPVDTLRASRRGGAVVARIASAKRFVKRR